MNCTEINQIAEIILSNMHERILPEIKKTIISEFTSLGNHEIIIEQIATKVFEKINESNKMDLSEIDINLIAGLVTNLQSKMESDVHVVKLEE